MKSSKINLVDAIEAVYELPQQLSDGDSITDVATLLSKLEYGEIVIKVVNGSIETIQITSNYKPIAIDKVDI